MPSETKIVAESGSRTIVLTRTFATKRSRIFEAWTKPEHVSRWWDPRGVQLSECHMDFRPGGSFRWVNRDIDGNSYPFSGTFREIVPPERLVLETPMSIGTLVFTEVDGGTELTLTLECRTVADRDQLLKMGVDAGTAETLASLDQYVAAMPQ